MPQPEGCGTRHEKDWIEPFAERMPCRLTEGKEGLSSELSEGQGERSRLKCGDPQVSFKGKQATFGVSFLGTWNKCQVTNLRLIGQPCQKSQKICHSRVGCFLSPTPPPLPYFL